MKKYDSKFEQPLKLNNRNLQKIINFYLLECPVENTSFRGKTFSDYGYQGPADYSRLKKKLLKNATNSLKSNYFPSKKEELESNFKKVSKVCYPDEYCVFFKYDERTIIRSLFSAIRNAIAHGSFNVRNYSGSRIYFFMNFKDYEKARIVLYEDTLLNWIKVVKGE